MQIIKNIIKLTHKSNLKINYYNYKHNKLLLKTNKKTNIPINSKNS